MERQIRKKYIYLLCRRYGQAVLQLAFFVQQLVVAHLGWQFIGQVIKLQGNFNGRLHVIRLTTVLGVFFKFYMTYLLIQVLLTFYQKRSAWTLLQKAKTTFKRAFRLYSWLGMLCFLSQFSSGSLMQITPIKLLVFLCCSVILFQRFVFLEDQQLIEDIFKKEPDGQFDEEKVLSIHYGWHKYLTLVYGEVIHTTRKTTNGTSKWGETHGEKQLTCLYRIVKSSFQLRIHEQLLELNEKQVTKPSLKGSEGFLSHFSFCLFGLVLVAFSIIGLMTKRDGYYVVLLAMGAITLKQEAPKIITYCKQWHLVKRGDDT